MPLFTSYGCALPWRRCSTAVPQENVPSEQSVNTSIPFRSQIMELLGSSLFDVRTESPRRFTDRMLACIAIEATTMLWHLHSRGCACTLCFPVKVFHSHKWLHTVPLQMSIARARQLARAGSRQPACGRLIVQCMYRTMTSSIQQPTPFQGLNPCPAGTCMAT